MHTHATGDEQRRMLQEDSKQQQHVHRHQRLTPVLQHQHFQRRFC